MTIAIPPEFGYAVGVVGASVFVNFCKFFFPAASALAPSPSISVAQMARSP